jgi:uncharacterized protein
MPIVGDLRAQAITRSLFAPTSLAAALERAAFVQADPIRAPATAQDLILRQRVAGYRAGDLERAYPSLPIDEGYLLAYGFLTRELWRLLHPPREGGLTKLERRVLDLVRDLGQAHPKDLAAHLGVKRTVNAWGGKSKVTTLALDALAHRGLLRVARREAGIRVFEPAAGRPQEPSALRRLVLATATIMAPVPEPSLRAAVRGLRRLGEPRDALKELLASGELVREVVEGVPYVSLPGATEADVPRRVRLLAPFDPVVWDRRRFEHLWGWAYRFEAYTPIAKRVRGYYALPLLWLDRVIGWANATTAGGELEVDVGFVGGRPRGPEFRRELDAEVERLREFLRG